MELRTKHRILGVFVVLGLVIIMLPFLQSSKDGSIEPTVIKAPPFPDQMPEVTTSTELETESDPTTKSESFISTQHPNIVSNESPSETIKQPEVVKTAEKEAIEPPLVTTTVVAGSDPTPITKTENSQVIKTALHQKVHRVTHPIKKKMAHTIKKHSPRSTLDGNGLVKLKKRSWVIQMGSFKDKTNALRLVNQLRSKGYSAFIQEVSTALGGSTRVFVGPEIKHSSAHAIVSQLETDMHIHGIIISYKPLAL